MNIYVYGKQKFILLSSTPNSTSGNKTPGGKSGEIRDCDRKP